MPRVLDYSWGRPGAPAVKADGAIGVMRYVNYPGAGGKGLTASELAALHAEGLGVGVVYESTEGRALEGAMAGEWDANVARNVMAQMDWPLDRPIYFAVDTDVAPALYPSIDAYFGACCDVLGVERVGVYGEADLLDHLHDAGLAAWFWQAAAPAWSGYRYSVWRHLQQFTPPRDLNGAEVDDNEAFGEDQGLWYPQRESALNTTALERATFSGGEEAHLSDADRDALVADRIARYSTTEESLASRLGSLTNVVKDLALAVDRLDFDSIGGGVAADIFERLDGIARGLAQAADAANGDAPGNG